MRILNWHNVHLNACNYQIVNFKLYSSFHSENLMIIEMLPFSNTNGENGSLRQCYKI